MSAGKTTLVIVATVTLAAVSVFQQSAIADRPAVTTQQLEADWLQQLLLRYPRDAQASEARMLGGAASAVRLPTPCPPPAVAEPTGDDLERAPLNTVVREVIDGGLRLAEDLRNRGVDVNRSVDALERMAALHRRLGDGADRETSLRAYLEAQRVIRSLSLQNPLLDFDDVLFVKRAPGRFAHMSDQHFSWWSRPGGGLYVLTGLRNAKPTVHCLTEGWEPGSFMSPDISHDGQRMLFAYCRHYPHLADADDKTDKGKLPEDGFYHVFEMNLDGTDARQLTTGRYDDFDAHYLPNGNIVFLSTRKGTALQPGKASAVATADATCPDSYARCGGDNERPVAIYTLHTIDAAGGELCAISAFESFEWSPAVASDGRILYSRWDYVDRYNADFMSLWSTNPDGTNSQLIYGNFTVRPQCIFEARPIPGSKKFVFTASAHHSITGGSLVLLDRTRGTEFDRPVTRLTPEVCFPETEGWPDSYYANPWPLSERYHLVSWSDRPLPQWERFSADDPRNPPNASGVYLYDAFGNLTLLHRDPAISSVTPIPVRARRVPPHVPSLVDWTAEQEGTFLVQDVYRGLVGVPRGAVTHLRIVGVPPKVQPHMGQPKVGVVSEAPGKFVLGTVPVEEDGSACFRLPSSLPVFFQALDSEGLALQTMRSLAYVQPGQVLACVGCHEHRDTAPPTAAPPRALQREPSRLTTGPDGTWPLRFDRLVQPVLNRHCVSCHHPKSRDEAAAKFDLTPDRAYYVLLNFGRRDLHNLIGERDRSFVEEMPARKSKLYQMLTAAPGHKDVRLSDEDRERLVTWMDTYAHVIGSFSEQQEGELRQLRLRYASLLREIPRERYDDDGGLVSRWSIFGILKACVRFPNCLWLGTSVVVFLAGGFACRSALRRLRRRG